MTVFNKTSKNVGVRKQTFLQRAYSVMRVARVGKEEGREAGTEWSCCVCVCLSKEGGNRY